MESDKKKIIIIEDYTPLLNAMFITLSKYHWDILTAKDGIEGEKQIREHVPNLIILDLHMPKRDGFELLEIIKKDRKLKAIPVVIVSNFMDIGDISKVKKFGVDEYLQKTELRMKELPNIVSKYLN